MTEKCARSNNNLPIECYAGAADFVLFSVIALQFFVALISSVAINFLMR